MDVRWKRASEESPTILAEIRSKWHLDLTGILRSAQSSAYASLRMTLLKKFVEVELTSNKRKENQLA